MAGTGPLSLARYQRPHLTSPPARGRNSEEDVIADVLILSTIPFGAGFIAGYALRAYLSRQRRMRALGVK